MAGGPCYLRAGAPAPAGEQNSASVLTLAVGLPSFVIQRVSLSVMQTSDCVLTLGGETMQILAKFPLQGPRLSWFPHCTQVWIFVWSVCSHACPPRIPPSQVSSLISSRVNPATLERNLMPIINACRAQKVFLPNGLRTGLE